MTEVTTKHEQDEIDLVELLINLWREKIIIVGCTLFTTALAIAYLIITPKTYTASIQIEPPQASELAAINNTGFFNISTDAAFNDLLQTLESNSHRETLIQKEKELLADMYNLPSNKINSSQLNINNLYEIRYPDSKDTKENSRPNVYKVLASAHNREATIKFLESNISLATVKIIDEWRQEFNNQKTENLIKNRRDFEFSLQEIESQIKNKITRITEETDLKSRKINDNLIARKNFVIKNRENRIIELKEALKIARNLNITNPSSLNRLSNTSSTQNNSQIEVTTEIKDQGEPLYLRGSKLLSAELESLEKLPRDTFIDSKIIELENQLLLLKNNRDIEILLAREDQVAFNEQLENLQSQKRKLEITDFPKEVTLGFSDSSVISSMTPAKPKNVLILALAIFLGGIFGVLLALTKLTIEQRKTKSTQKPD